MVRNYFKIALRGFWRRRFLTAINIAGLSMGITAAIVIYLIVQFDFQFNKFQPDTERIYRVVTYQTFSGEEILNSGVTGPLPEAVRNDVAGIETAAPFSTFYQSNVLIPKSSAEIKKFKDQQNIILASPEYFKLFHYKWIAGSAESALSAPNQVVLSSEQAKIYFPSLSYNQMTGKTVIYDSIRTTVSGIVEPLKGNTDFEFHDFISYATANTNKDIRDRLQLTEWGSTNSSSQFFIRLSRGVSAQNIEQQLRALQKKYSPAKPEDKGNILEFRLQPLSDLHFSEKYGSFDSGRTASKTILYSLLAIGAFLLLLACINFINLSTAQAAQRAKEIGIRKTMGSSRYQLIVQFLSETYLITLVAVMIAVALSPVVLKLFADFIPKGVKADFACRPDLLLFLALLTLVVSLFSGFYPALVLSAYKPVLVLKNQAVSGSSKTRNSFLRKILTVTQFIIAQFFIMATLLVSKQIYYVLHKDMGFKKEGILTVHLPWKRTDFAKDQVFLAKLRALPQVELLSAGGAPPSAGGTSSTEYTYQDGKKEIKTDVQLKYGDENYIKLYHIRLLSGRNLKESDTSKAVLINETYARVLGFNHPADATGTYLKGSKKPLQVIGVVADFYQKSLRSPVKPLAILTSAQKYNVGTIHIALKPETAGGGQWKAALTGMQKAWKELYPDDDFDYAFFDESIAKFYQSEQHTSTLLSWATGISVMISCPGLLGLAVYTTNQRTKEIGVRKVLGASALQIVHLLSQEMIVLVLLAFVLVTPVAWWAMHKWMQDFADRTPISWWLFASSGLGMLLVALATLSLQTIKAAFANPVKSLRSE